MVAKTVVVFLDFFYESDLTSQIQAHVKNPARGKKTPSAEGKKNKNKTYYSLSKQEKVKKQKVVYSL